METVIEKKLKDYILLTKKDQSSNESHQNVMIAGLEAMLSSLKSDTDLDDVVNELYQYLDKDKKGLDDYLELTKKLDELNSPVTVSEIQYVIAGIESFKDSQEFISENGNEQFNFLKLFKFFSKFRADAAHLSSCSEEEIDAKYPGLSEDMDFTTPEGKKISCKYKFLAKFFKILANILIMRAYVLNAIASCSKVIAGKLKDLYKSELNALRALEKSISKSIADISKSIKEIEGRAGAILDSEYEKLVSSRKELQGLHNKLQYQVKVEIVSKALNSDQDAFAPIFDVKNREAFAKIAETNIYHKQDNFTGLTGILNTRPDLSPLRNVMKEIFNNTINDALIIAVFGACIAIAREVSRSQPSFEAQVVYDRKNNINEVDLGVAPAT